jgi:hypothetical protein
MRAAAHALAWPRGNLRTWLAIAILLTSVCSAWAAVSPDGSLERRVKAAILYNFAAYVEWPESAFPQADSAVTIGVLDAESVAAELATIVAGRKVGTRSIAVRHMREGDSLEGLHILFAPAAEGARVRQLARYAQSRSILLITEADGALELGSVINLVAVDRRVGFEISLDSAEKSRLKLSARLLSVAQQVKKGS